MGHLRYTGFMELDTAIRQRRSTKPATMDTQPLSEALIGQLLEAAQWAPTHGMTEPWRFIRFRSEQSRSQLGQWLKEALETHGAELGRNPGPAKLEKCLQKVHWGGAVIGVWALVGTNPKVPELEDLLAVACGVQNMLLKATELGLASMWSTGESIYHPLLARRLGLPENGRFLGLIFVGYPTAATADRPRSGTGNKLEVR